MESDEQLIARWRSGCDLADLDTLVRRNVTRFYGTARAMLNSATDAEDVAQEAILRVVKALKSYDGRASFRTWSYTILLNTVRTFLRKQRTANRSSEMGAEAVLAAPHAPVDGRLLNEEVRVAVQSAMDQLTEKQRAAVVLTLMEGMSAIEAAEIENCTAAAIYQRVREARKALSHELGLKRIWQGE